jgi:hypothetical protein
MIHGQVEINYSGIPLENRWMRKAKENEMGYVHIT